MNAARLDTLAALMGRCELARMRSRTLAYRVETTKQHAALVASKTRALTRRCVACATGMVVHRGVRYCLTCYVGIKSA